MAVPSLRISGVLALIAAAGPGSPLLADTSTCAVPTTDLVHLWHGDGNAGDSVGDADGTASGSASFTTGRFGQGFGFDGVDGVDDSWSFGTTSGNFGTSDFTVSYWINSTNTTEIQGVFGKRASCAHGSFWDNRLNPTGTMNVELDQDAGGTNHNSIGTAATMNDGAFHLLSYVRSATTLRVYVDGVESASNATTGVTNISNSANLIAGLSACTGQDGTTRFEGVLDEIQIYDRALSPCEILAGIDAGIDVDLDGSVAPLTDMLLLLRYFFGFRDAVLVSSAVGADCLRCDAETIQVVIEALRNGLDVDGNGAVAPLTDGLLLLRYAFGFRGGVLLASATAGNCTRCDGSAIEGFLDPLFP